MKILKPGRAKMLKLRCDNCGCEFVYEYYGNVYFTETARVKCPQDGCNGEVFLQSGERYEEPVQDKESDAQRLRKLIAEGMRIYSDYGGCAEHLIANGVTFREDENAKN